MFTARTNYHQNDMIMCRLKMTAGKTEGKKTQKTNLLDAGKTFGCVAAIQNPRWSANAVQWRLGLAILLRGDQPPLRREQLFLQLLDLVPQPHGDRL